MRPFYLLDTNALSELVRDPKGPVAKRVSQIGQDSILTSIIVAAELRFGSVKKGSARLSERIDNVLRMIEVVPFEPPADRVYAELRTALERDGRPIGSNDCLIAAHAIYLETTLVTANRHEFSRVPGLLVEDWKFGG